jgi:hypothetical protein
MYIQFVFEINHHEKQVLKSIRQPVVPTGLIICQIKFFYKYFVPNGT